MLFQATLLKLSFLRTFKAGNFASALRNGYFTVLYLDLGTFGGSNLYVAGNPQPELSDKMFSPVEVNSFWGNERKKPNQTPNSEAKYSEKQNSKIQRKP